MGSDIVNRVLAVFGSSLGVQVITIVFTPILVRLLGVAEYGEYAFMLSVLSLSVVGASAGTFDSARKFIAERRSTPNWRNHVFGVYARVILVLGGILALSFVIVARFGLVETLLDETFVLYFYVLALLVPLQAIFRLSRSALMGLDLEARSEPLFILQRLLFVILALVFAWIGWGVIGVLIGRALALVIVVALTLVYLSRKLDLSMVVRPTPASFPRRTLLSYNTSTVALKILMTSLYNLDIVLLGVLVGSTATGSYRAALVIAGFIWFVPTAIQVGLLHSTSRLWEEDEYERITALSTRAVRFTLVFTLLLVLGVAALAEPLVSLYFGSDFIHTADTLLFLLPGALGFAVARPIFAISQGHGNLRPVLLATGSAATLNLVLNVILIPLYSTVGAAAATSAGYGSMLMFHTMAARRLGFDPIDDLRLGRITVTAALAMIPIFGLTWLLHGNLLPLVVVPSVGFIIYTTLALRTRAIDPMEVWMIFASTPIGALPDALPPRISAVLRRSLNTVIGTQQ